MFALAELAAMVLEAPVTPGGQSSQQIARCYLEAVCDCWRDGGTERSRSFQQRLTLFRTTAMPTRPFRPSDAASPHGGGGRGIDWYELPDVVAGYIAGVPEGYVVPLPQVAELIAAVDRAGTACARRVRGAQCPDPIRELADGAIVLVL
jgi:hypothetical protein